MKKYNTQAIVLKNINYKDSDKIYTLLTPQHGKVSAAAKGVRKISSRRAGNLDTLNLIELKISENDKGHKNIDEVKTINSFRNLKNSYEKTSQIYYLVELVHKAVEEDNNIESIFKLLRRVLELADKETFPLKTLISFFEATFLRYLGYMPHMSNMNIPQKSKDILEKLMGGKLKELSDEDVATVEPIIKSYVYEHLSEKYKSLELEG